jgi:hypothetical protein
LDLNSRYDGTCAKQVLVRTGISKILTQSW